MKGDIHVSYEALAGRLQLKLGEALSTIAALELAVEQRDKTISEMQSKVESSTVPPERTS